MVSRQSIDATLSYRGTTSDGRAKQESASINELLRRPYPLPRSPASVAAPEEDSHSLAEPGTSITPEIECASPLYSLQNGEGNVVDIDMSPDQNVTVSAVVAKASLKGATRRPKLYRQVVQVGDLQEKWKTLRTKETSIQSRIHQQRLILDRFTDEWSAKPDAGASHMIKYSREHVERPVATRDSAGASSASTGPVSSPFVRMTLLPCVSEYTSRIEALERSLGDTLQERDQTVRDLEHHVRLLQEKLDRTVSEVESAMLLYDNLYRDHSELQRRLTRQARVDQRSRAKDETTRKSIFYYE